MRLLLLVAPLALVACGDARPAENTGLGTQEPTTASAPADAEEKAPDRRATHGMTSRYSDAAPENCTVAERVTEGSYVRMRCPGVGEYPLIVEESDGRVFIHAGTEPEVGETMAPFNTLAQRIEWRMRGEEPLALIYRLIVATPDSPRDGESQLFVAKIGRDGMPGCVMAEIAGSYPQANIEARSIADRAAQFRCDRDEKRALGDVML